MAISKLVLFSLVFALIVTHPSSVVSTQAAEVVDSGSHEIELDQLNSKINFREEAHEESKDEILANMKKIIKEKDDIIASLNNEIESIQRKGTLDTVEQVGKAHAWASELEKQVDKLKKDIETERSEKQALEARNKEAEKVIHELNLKLKNLENNNDEKKAKINNYERALKVAEEEMMKAKFEAQSKTKELMEVHGAWFPPWLAGHLMRYQSFMEAHWNLRGKPAMETMIQKAAERKAEAEKWAEPYLETVKIKYIPAIKEKWVVIATYVEPHVQSLSTKSIEVYEATKSSVAPHVIKVHEYASPYFQEAKKFSKPYIDQVVSTTKPHVDKARVVLKPYTQKLIHAYGNFLEYATSYHHKVQVIIQERLQKHELTRAFATKELVWFTASALLALPVILFSRICASLFCNKPKKPNRTTNTNQTRRKAKRGHPDK